MSFFVDAVAVPCYGADVLGLRTPLRSLQGSAARLLLTVVALAAAVALVCAIDLANRSVYAAFSEVIDTMAGRASLYVTAGENGLVPDRVAAQVADVPGVELAVPVVQASAFLTDGSGQQLLVHGVDIADDQAVRVYEPDAPDAPALEDPLLFLSQPDSVMLTREFAARRGLGEGDAIELQTPSGRRRFTVRGLLAPRGVGTVQGGNLILMDIQAAEQAFTRPGLASRIDIVVQRDADPPAVGDAVQAVLPPGLRVELPAQRRVNLHRVMRAAQTMMTAVSVLGIVAAFLIAFGRLSTVFDARAWQVAVLRAAGVRTRRVWWELAKESLLVGLAGVVIGIPAGIAVGRLVLPVVAQTTALTANLVATEASLHVRPVSVVLAAALGLLTALLAAALPAWRAARVPIVETLRGRGVEQPGAAGAGSWLALALVVGAAGLALALHAASGDASIGLTASGLLVVCAVLAARPLLAVLRRPLEASLPLLAGATGRFAVQSLLVRPRRTALAVTTVGVGFGTVVWLWTVAGSFEQSVLEVVPHKLRGDLSVGSAHLEAGYLEAAMDGSLIDAIAAVPGVEIVVGERVIDWRYANGPISIDAFDPPYFRDPRFGPIPLVGRQLPDALGAVARGEAVIVSENFVRNLGKKVGDLLTLDTPSGPLTLPIAGVWPDFLSSRGTVDMSRDVMRTWWRDEHVVRGLVKVAPGVPVADVRDAIAARLGARYGLRVLTLGALVEWFAGQVRRGFAAFHVLAALLLVLVLVGVGDALAATTLERTREFGVTRAVGVRRRALGRIVVLEALLLGALGLAMALAVGLLLGALWVQWTFPSLLGWTIAFHLPLVPLTGLALAVIGTCVLASYLPAVRAARLDPVAALRTE